MKIQAAPLPSLPKVPHARGPLEVDIDYTGPVRQDTHLGQIPKDFYTYSGYTQHNHTDFPNAQSPITDGVSVVRPQPVLGCRRQAANGSHQQAHQGSGRFRPQARRHRSPDRRWPRTVRRRFSGHPYRLGRRLGGSHRRLGHRRWRDRRLSVANDRVRLEWREQPILNYRLRGYDERVSEDSHSEKDTFGNGSHSVTDGYWHRFTPDLGAKSLGTYMEPMVVHYNARTGEVRRVEGELKANEV